MTERRPRRQDTQQARQLAGQVELLRVQLLNQAEALVRIEHCIREIKDALYARTDAIVPRLKLLEDSDARRRRHVAGVWAALGSMAVGIVVLVVKFLLEQ